MIRYKVVVAYDGSAYHGWQTQHKGNSVQEQIEDALSAIQKDKIEIHASGRTDAKVHALGQVFHFDSFNDMDAQAYMRGLNGLLPKDIRVKHIESVDDTFHARFYATSKRYDYYLTNDVNNPFLLHYMGKENKVLDVEYMQQCARLFLGTHDFTTFTSAKIDARKSRVKTITRCEVQKEGNHYHFILEGNGFLRYMVRMIVQTIIETGKKELSLDEVKLMLESKDKHLCRYKADASGLYLVSVTY